MPLILSTSCKILLKYQQWILKLRILIKLLIILFNKNCCFDIKKMSYRHTNLYEIEYWVLIESYPRIYLFWQDGGQFCFTGGGHLQVVVRVVHTFVHAHLQAPLHLYSWLHLEMLVVGSPEWSHIAVSSPGITSIFGLALCFILGKIEFILLDLL